MRAVRLAGYALLVTAAACGGGGAGGDITPPTPTVTQMTLSPNSATVVAGQSASIVAQPKDASGNAVNGLTVGWSSSDPSVATVSGGTVTAIKPGQATITATVGTVSSTAAVTVIPAVANVAVSPSTNSLLVGQTANLTATLTDAGGTTITGRTVTWSSSNAAVASVNATTGVVTANALGTATISAAVEGKSGTASVEVKSATVTSVSVSSGTVRVGQRTQFHATGTLSDGTSQTLTGSAVAWLSSDPTKATVDADGFVTGVATGSATITATNGSSGKSGSGTASVVAANAPTLLTLSVSPTSVDVRTGAQTVTVSGTASDGSGTGLLRVDVTAKGHTISSTHPDPTATCSTTGSIPASGAWSCTLTIPRGAAAGEWPLVSVVITDNASHVTSYGASDIAAAYSNSKFTVTSDEDVTAPTLQSITVAPTNFDVRTSPQTVAVTARYTDDLSGTVSFTYRATSLAHPNVFVECTGTRQSGTATDGVWGCSVVFPQGAPGGNWSQTFTAVDAAFNKVSNTPQALLIVAGSP